MRGSISASPRATHRTASTRSSGGTSLRRKPLAPARTAANRYSSRSKVVRMSTLAPVGVDEPPGCFDAVHARHAHVHEHDIGLGAARPRSMASMPSPASPTTSKSSSLSRIRRKPGPDESLVVDDDDPDAFASHGPGPSDKHGVDQRDAGVDPPAGTRACGVRPSPSRRPPRPAPACRAARDGHRHGRPTACPGRRRRRR